MSMTLGKDKNITLSLRGKLKSHWQHVYDGHNIANTRHLKKTGRPLSLTAYIFNTLKEKSNALKKEEEKKIKK